MLHALLSQSSKHPLRSVLVGSVLLSSTALSQVDTTVTAPVAQDDDLVEVYYNPYTGYGKRPRVGLLSEGFVSPSQLHEVYGAHAGVAGQFETSKVDQDQSYRAQTLRVDARGMYGWEKAKVGLGVGYQDNKLTPEDGVERSDITRQVLVARPQVAMSLSRHFTVGLTGNLYAENLKIEDLDAVEGIQLAAAPQPGDSEADFQYNTVSAGLSYHDERSEFGVVYTSDAEDEQTLDDSDEVVRIYRAPVTTLFGRGNLTDIFSLHGSLSYTSPERANEFNEGRDLYDRYDVRDRLGGKLAGILWTTERSRFVLGGSYAGGQYLGANGDDEFLGLYGLTNRYGVDAELTIRVVKSTSLSIVGGVNRGERNETVDGVEYSQREQRARIGTSVNMWL